MKRFDEAMTLFIGSGDMKIRMHHGNYRFRDQIEERRKVELTNVISKDGETSDEAIFEYGESIKVRASKEDGRMVYSFESCDPKIERIWVRIPAKKDEHVYGCGEQMSYFDLRGRNYPIWTQEPGVGRDPENSYISWIHEQNEMGGGDYHTTYCPAPTFVSSELYFLHADFSGYSDFDFRNEDYHEIMFLGIPKKIIVGEADSFPNLLKSLTDLLGRQEILPDWITGGLILGVQGGDRSFELMEKCIENGVEVTGLWCQDWCGKRVTSFGKRLQWDWHYSEEMYPDLPKKIEELHKRGIKFLGYINPYLVKGGMLFEEGVKEDAFIKKIDGSLYLVDFGEFDCAIPDLTNPRVFDWYKNVVIKKYSIDIGIDGWMADFGEYLPVDDMVLHSGNSPMMEHNRWPVLWAKCNYEAVKESGKFGEVVYFMRAGGTGSQKYCTLLWAGDQSVDFSRHDGLVTVICAVLSSGMTGLGLNHSDIGGYTSLYENLRTKEVFLRWAEMSVFMPVMRTHEGNRPDTNYQFYDDDDAIEQMARLTKIHKALQPLFKELIEEYSECGSPVMRPLFFHYTDDEECFTNQFEYMLGPDVLVAPVWKEDAKEWEVYLPAGEWTHLWSGKVFGKGRCVVPSPIGEPPVFYKADSKYAELLAGINK